MRSTFSFAAALLFTGTSLAQQLPIIKSVVSTNGRPLLTVESTPGYTDEIVSSAALTAVNWPSVASVVVTQVVYSVVPGGGTPVNLAFYRVRSSAPVVPASMALIPGGQVGIGDAFAEGWMDELPVHTARVSTFYIDRSEISFSLWSTVMAWSTNSGYRYDNLGAGKGPAHPANLMNWYDAVKWCNARSQRDGFAPAYHTDAGFSQVYRTGQVDAVFVNWNATGYRLPTELEWETAARGGASGGRFPWVDTNAITHAKANYYSDGTQPYDDNLTVGYQPYFTNSFPHHNPVGFFPANPFGMFDVTGNVSEWCWDWYDSAWYANPGASQDNTRGPVGPGTRRSLRSSNFSESALYARVSCRSSALPTSAKNWIGLRCVRKF
jgi:formylglycine-generating enzyme required for sulfatase activity